MCPRKYIEFDAEFTCNSTYMMLKLNKTALEDRNPVFKIAFKDVIQYPDSNCLVFSNNATTQNDSFIWIESKLTECGIKQREDKDNIVFNQTIVIQYGNNPAGGMIYREEIDSYDVSCKISRNGTAVVFIGSVTEKSLMYKKSKHENRYHCFS